MAILSKGTDFSTGDQVTAANLDALVDNATFASGAVDGVTTSLDSSSPQKIIVKNGGIGTNQLATSDSTTTGVTFAKMQHVAANTVLVRDSSSAGDISAKAVANTQILIGDGTGFTAAALSGDVTMTNAGAVTIADDAVDSAQIADGAIDLVHMSANSVDSNQYVDGSIDAVHIASSAVTTAKLENSSSKTTGVTFAKMQHISTAKILGRRSSGEGDVEEAFDFKDEDNMSSNSATALASQQSIKAYTDSKTSDPARGYESTSNSTASANVQQNTTGRPLWTSFTFNVASGNINSLLLDISPNSDMSSSTRIGQSRIDSDGTSSSGTQVTGIVPDNFYWRYTYSTTSTSTEKVHSSFVL